MKFHFQKYFALLVVFSMLLLAACGPESTVHKQAKETEPAAQKPVVQEQQPAPAPAPVEQPKPVAKAKTRPAVKEAPAKAQPAPQATNSGIQNRPAAHETASTAPGTLTLPAPVPPPVAAPGAPPVDDVKPVVVEPPAPRTVRIPSGTLVAVRMIDSVDSETARVGETFKASLDEALMADNEVVFPKGAEVYVKLSKVQSAGRVSGRSEVQLQLDRIFLGRKSYLLESNTYTNTGAGQAGRTARSAGIGAAIGAAIGAISGGGKGAVIGGATGAGAGAGVEAIRKGEQVRVDSESRLDFRLEDSIEVTLTSSPNTTQRNNPSGPVRLGTRP